jgi:Uma2 family endonuclease
MALTTQDLRRITVDEFNRMCEHGVFRPDERLELIEGTIVEMTPIGPLHAACVDRLTEIFTAPAARERVRCRVQGPIQIGQNNRPQPDVTILRRREDYYATGLPNAPGDVLLVVEVADASLERDRRLKIPLYAQGDIAEHWLVNLVAREIEVYREPHADGTWGRVTRVEPHGSLAPLALADLIIPASQILGQV